MHTKEFSIALDMVRANSFRPFEVVECDTGNVLHILLKNDGEAMDLTGCSICIVFASKTGFAMQDLTSGISLGEQAGTVDVTLFAESFGPGEVTADVQVYSGAEYQTLITSKRFTFRCVTALISPEIIAANATYPPLIAATKAANEAAEAALGAINAIDTAVGELNVQADWNEANMESDAYIKNRPMAFLPSWHAGSHGIGGTDFVSPASIGAAALAHASRHAASGADPITPESIGAAGTSSALPATLLAASWAGAEAPYSYTLPVTGVTANTAVEVLPPLNPTVEQLEALQGANMQDGGQSAGGITIKAYGEKPAIDLPIRVIVRGDL